MQATERDDLVHAIDQTMGFYGKTLDKTGMAIWLRSMRNFPVDAVKLALIEYTEIGKHAPKPVDIREIVAANDQRAKASLPPAEKTFVPCPPVVQAAWMWFIGVCTDGSALMDGVFDGSRGVDAATEERYLRIVNEEAKASNRPDAIPKKYRLAEVWG